MNIKLNLKQCPCCSGNNYNDCCGQFISKANFPESPEQLMRSRYTAYAIANIDYIFDTMREKALKGADRAESLKWSKTSNWLGLEIIEASDVDSSSDYGEVKFVAKFIQDNKQHELKEHSSFKKIDGRWYYVGGIENYDIENNYKPVEQRVAQKIGRNDPCTCGSGKKYKKCCL